uniref:peptidyl-tRNA hydrolase n=2 Tax=Parasteatoda tepidariorum TaxID=114398 RepID=A0A2L2Y615_PARTP
MGVVTFMSGLCAGFYLRNTQPGLVIANKIFAAVKRSNNYGTKFKMALVVREDLKMGCGKIASQCGHATLSAYKLALLHDPDVVPLWEACRQKKIALKVKSEKEMLKLSDEAKKLGLLTSIIVDGGLTQVDPFTKTVLAIGPGPEEVVNKVTQNLKLL